MKKKIIPNFELYRGVLEDLIKQKNQLQFRIGEIDSALAALHVFYKGCTTKGE
jgi:hypothetical protein